MRYRESNPDRRTMNPTSYRYLHIAFKGPGVKTLSRYTLLKKTAGRTGFEPVTVLANLTPPRIIPATTPRLLKNKTSI